MSIELDSPDHISDQPLEASAIKQFARGRRGLTDWQSCRVKKYISDNIATQLRVSDLALAAKISTGHFTRSFYITFGTSPYAFIMTERMAKAKELLLGSNSGLSTIAQQCGMSDHSHFTRLFRRLEGLSPSEWRRRRSAPSPSTQG